MMATLLFLAGYLAYIACMVALWYLLLIASMSAFPSAVQKYDFLVMTIVIVLPFVLKNLLWLALISAFPSTLTSSVSEIIATLLGLAGYLVYIACMIGLSLLVFIMAIFLSNAALRLHPEDFPDWIYAIVLGVTFVVMDMFMKHFSVSDTMARLLGLAHYLTGMIATPLLALLVLSFLVPLLFLLGLAHYLTGMIATPLLALLVLSFLVPLLFLVLLGLDAWVTILLPSATHDYPKLMFASIVGLTFMVTKNMLDTSVEKSALISESFSTFPSIFSNMKAILLGLAGFIYDYRVAYLVLRYLTILALALLLLVSNLMSTCTNYTKAAVIITLGVVLTMRLPGTPNEMPALICESPSAPAASTMVLDDFIRISEEMREEHKMVVEKIISGFNLLIDESKGTIQSIVIHTILILVTLIGGIVFYVLNQYDEWINTKTQKAKELMKDRFPVWADILTEKANKLIKRAISEVKIKNKKAISKAGIIVRDKLHYFSWGLIGSQRPETRPSMHRNT